MGQASSQANDILLQNAQKLQEKYHIQKVKLGSGSFGTVWRAVNRETHTKVAIKAVDRRKMREAGLTEHDLIREIHLLAELRDCENITGLFEAFQDEDNFYLALEYSGWGDFGDMLVERGSSLEEWEAANWMAQIVNALSYLHARSILHRDIKPENFLVGDGIYGSTNMLKLADFGLAMRIDSPNAKISQKCGTPAFMAPEQHLLPRSGGYGLAADVWAAGVCMWCILHAGAHPFMEMQTLRLADLLQGKPPFKKAKGFWGKRRWTEAAERLCHRMLNNKAEERPLIFPVAQDIWFQNCQKQIEGKQEYQSDLEKDRLSNSRSVGSTARADDLDVVDELQRKNKDLRDRLRRCAEKHEAYERKIQELENQLHQESTTKHTGWIDGMASGVRHVKKGVASSLRDIMNVEQPLEEPRLQQERSWEPSTKSEDVFAFIADSPSPRTPQEDTMGNRQRQRVAREKRPILLKRGQSVKFLPLANSVPVNAKVLRFNPNDETYDLDIRTHAALERISAPDDIVYRWPDQSSIQYEDLALNVWIDGTIVGFNNGTYTIGEPGGYAPLAQSVGGQRLKPRVHGCATTTMRPSGGNRSLKGSCFCIRRHPPEMRGV